MDQNENSERRTGIAERVVAFTLIVLAIAGAVIFHGEVPVNAIGKISHEFVVLVPIVVSVAFAAIRSIRRGITKFVLSIVVRQDGKAAGVSWPAFVLVTIVISAGVYVATAFLSHGVAEIAR